MHFAAGEVAFLDYLDLYGNLSLQLFHVADDAHVAAFDEGMVIPFSNVIT